MIEPHWRLAVIGGEIPIFDVVLGVFAQVYVSSLPKPGANHLCQGCAKMWLVVLVIVGEYEEAPLLSGLPFCDRLAVKGGAQADLDALLALGVDLLANHYSWVTPGILASSLHILVDL